MKKDAGSYQFDAMPNMDTELARLKQQAQLAAPLERNILKIAGLGEGFTALDMGCGPGLVSVEMAILVGAKGSVLGVDISENLLGVGERYADQEEVNNVTFQLGNAYELDLPDSHFDFVYARMFVQHLEKPQVAMAELRRILKPGGILCIMDIDDAMTVLEPEPPEFAAYQKAALEGQKKVGGDRHVGRKLFGYLREQGLEDVTITPVPITSDQLSMPAFLEVGFSFKRHIPEDSDKAAKEWQAIQAFCLGNPASWGCLNLFVAVGKKA